ncbi:MAG: hypothetical protein NDI84_05115 [Steroidobacteraceae bacterium]|nr:hypothetical protein [Steroidobacteraceae bacterium]
MTRYLFTLLFAFSAVAFGATGNISKVNSSISVDAGQQAGDVSTVNGSITIHEDARVRDVETVNGSIKLHARAQANEAETVNGDVTLAEDVLVSGNVETVNGEITLRRGARVDGDLENVNGDFEIDGATVRGGLETTNGDVRIGAGSRVEGGLLVEKPSGWGWNHSKRLPRVTIESGAVVSGSLRFEREVELQVASDATVGPIEGVAPKRIAER